MKSAVVLRYGCAKAKLTATFWSQVLAQLHGIPAEEDEQDEQQEDAQGTAGSQDHRRPRSAGHLTEPSSSTSTHKIGRPPLAETTATNKLGLKVPVHGIVMSWSAVYWLKSLLDTGAYMYVCISILYKHACGCSKCSEVSCPSAPGCLMLHHLLCGVVSCFWRLQSDEYLGQFGICIAFCMQA